MTTYSHTVGSGGDYTSYGLWQSARITAGAAGSGDVEEAVFLDGTYTPGDISTAWPTGVTVRLRAENPHLNDWGATTQGVIFVGSGWPPGLYFSGTYNSITVEVVDIVGKSSPVYSARPFVLLGGSSVTFRAVRSICYGSISSSNNSPIFVTGATTNSRIELWNSVATVADGATGIYGVHMPWASNMDCELFVRGSTLHSIWIGWATGQVTDVELHSSIITNGITTSGGTRVATDCLLGSGTWTGWTTTNCSTTTCVTGTPSSGQVGFTNLTDRDYSLVDDANNLAIDYASNEATLTEDVLGVSRPQGADYDAGAFELEVAAGVEVTPGVASLTSTAFTPTVVATDDKSVTPGVVATTTQRYTPTVTATDNKSAAPGLATLTSTSYPPTVAATADLTVTPGLVTLTSTPRLPTVTATADVTVAPPTTTTTVTRYVPTVTATADVELTPGFASVTSTRYTPTVSITAGAEVFPAPATVTTSVFAPGVTVGFVVEPGTATLYFLGESASPGMLAPTTVASSAPTTVVTVGEWSDRVRLGPGDEWYVTLTGPSLPADAPQARVQLRFREYPS